MMTELGMHMVLWGILLKTLVHNERREENRMHRLNLNRSGELGEHKSVIGAACSADQGQEDIMAKGQPELVIGDPSIADTSIADNGIGLANGVGHARSEGVDNSKTLVLRVVSSSSPPAARDTMLMRCSEENTHSYDENRNDDINYHNQALDNDNYANNASARRDTENVNLEYQYNDVNNDSQGDEGVNGDNDARYRWRRVKGMDALNKLTEPRIILLFIVCNLFQNIYMTYGLYWMMNAHFCFKRKDNYCSSNTISEHTRTATHDGIHNNDPKVRILNCEE